MNPPFAPRIEAGDTIRLISRSSLAVVGLEAQVTVMLDDGNVIRVDTPITTTNATRARQDLDSPVWMTQGGWVVGANVIAQSNFGKRGQTYEELQIMNVTNRFLRQGLCKGYLYGAHSLTMGEFEEPLSGMGHLRWVQEANDAAGNVVTTVNLAATDARRIVRAVIVKYHQTGGAAATITITLRDLADSGGPTNWSIDSDTWVSPDLVLGANQEGLIHVGEHGFLSTNDAGVLAYADNTTAPNPFPLAVDVGDPVDLLIAAAAGASGDDYDVWVQYEEWIEV